MLHPEKFVQLGIDPPKGVLCYGPPGTGKTLLARAVANRTDACFIRVIGSELVQKYVGEGARMVRELFQMARSKKACLIFFDEIDAIGGARFDDGAGGELPCSFDWLAVVFAYVDHLDSRHHPVRPQPWRVAQVVTMRCSGQCWRLSISLTVLTHAGTSRQA